MGIFGNPYAPLNTPPVRERFLAGLAVAAQALVYGVLDDGEAALRVLIHTGFPLALLWFPGLREYFAERIDRFGGSWLPHDGIVRTLLWICLLLPAIKLIIALWPT